MEEKQREMRVKIDNNEDLIKTLSEREERRESEMKKMQQRASTMLQLT